MQTDVTSRADRGEVPAHLYGTRAALFYLLARDGSRQATVRPAARGRRMMVETRRSTGAVARPAAAVPGPAVPPSRPAPGPRADDALQAEIDRMMKLDSFVFA